MHARDVDAAVEAGTDWIGLSFPRARPVPAAVGSAALLVAPNNDDVRHVLDAPAPVVRQLYALAERCQETAAQFAVPVWQAVGVSSTAGLPEASRLDGPVIESEPPKDSDRSGGNGTGFDWRTTRSWQASVSWLLAGGVRPDNVRSAIAISGAVAVDVLSGVESTPGIKDPVLTRVFIDAAKGEDPAFRQDQTGMSSA